MISSKNDKAPPKPLASNPTNEQVCMLGLYAVGAAFLSLACQKDSTAAGNSGHQQAVGANGKELEQFKLVDEATSVGSSPIVDESSQNAYQSGTRAQEARRIKQYVRNRPSLTLQTTGNMPRLLRRSVEEHRVRPDMHLAAPIASAHSRDTTRSFDLHSSARQRLSMSTSRPTLSHLPHPKASMTQYEKSDIHLQDCFVQNLGSLGISGDKLAFDAPPSPTDPRQMQCAFSPPDDYLRSLGNRHPATGWNIQSPFSASADDSEVDFVKTNRGTFSKFFPLPRRKSRAASAPFAFAEEHFTKTHPHQLETAFVCGSKGSTSSRFRQRARSMSLDIPRFARNSLSALRSNNSFHKSSSTGFNDLSSSPRSNYAAEQGFVNTSPVQMNSDPSSNGSHSPSPTKMDDLPRESQSSDSDYDGVSSAQRSDHTVDSVDTDSSDSDEDDIEWETQTPSRTSQRSGSGHHISQPTYLHRNQSLIEEARRQSSFGNLRSAASRPHPTLQHAKSSPLLDSSRSASSHDSRSAGRATSRFGSKTTELAAVYLRNIIPSKMVYSGTAPPSSPLPLQASSVSRPSTSTPGLLPSPLAQVKVSSPQSSLKLFSDAASSTSSRTSPEWSTLEELVVTETKFLKDIQTLSSVYLDGMEQMDLMTSSSLDKIRSNLGEVIALSKHLIDMILSHIPTFSVSMEDEDLLALSAVLAKELPPRLEVFTRYCLSLAGAQERLAFEIQLRPAVGKFIQVCKGTNPNLQGMDLSQFLVLPMHRVTRYPLLFGNLAKKSARKQSWSNYNTELREEDEEGAEQAISDVQRCQERQDLIHRNWAQLCDATSAICKITNLAISYQDVGPAKEKRRMSMSPTKASPQTLCTAAAVGGKKGSDLIALSNQPPAAFACASSNSGDAPAVEQRQGPRAGPGEHKSVKKGFGRYVSDIFQGFRTPSEEHKAVH